MNVQAVGTSVVAFPRFAFARLGQAASMPERETGGGSLPSLGNSALSGRYCGWRGASDRRYVASIYPVERDEVDAGLPEFEHFVLIAVANGQAGRRILDASAIERETDRAAAIRQGLTLGADEWHVHLLGQGRRERAAMAADLLDRHGRSDTARCA